MEAPQHNINTSVYIPLCSDSCSDKYVTDNFQYLLWLILYMSWRYNTSAHLYRLLAAAPHLSWKQKQYWQSGFAGQMGLDRRDTWVV